MAGLGKVEGWSVVGKCDTDLGRARGGEGQERVIKNPRVKGEIEGQIFGAEGLDGLFGLAIAQGPTDL